MRIPLALVLAALAAGACAQHTGLRVADMAGVDRSVKRRAAALTELTRSHRQVLARAGRYHAAMPLSFPTVVRLAQGGSVLPMSYAPLQAGSLTLRFDTSGSRVFPDTYRALLQAVFDQSGSTLDAVFGTPVGGEVWVRNFDADIGDRDAVAGGVYLPNNGAGQREIRFPVYEQDEAAAVNFVHCLLLAYQGDLPYGFDAFEEGLVRAATLRVCRTAGALPASLASDLVEQALENTYDVGPAYDWCNQRALGGPTFVAPNLLEQPLPAGGSVGGLYLLRYQMAGSAWQKAVVENPGFIAELNRRVRLEPTSVSDVPRLVELGQAALDTVKGTSVARLEGLPFSDWFQRQHALSTALVLGPKLLVQPTPIPPEAGTGDFGVFDVAAHAFFTQPGGNETLAAGTAYPIFWDFDFNRITPSAQDTVLRLAGGYDSVTPNFPDLYAGQPYRMAIDVPFGAQMARALVPAGAVATGANPETNDLFGTVSGAAPGATLKVRVVYGSTTFDLPVANGAFGGDAPTAAFLRDQRLRVDVVRLDGSTETVALRRWVNKGVGPLGVDLRLGADATHSLDLPLGLSAFALPLEPFESSPSALLAVPAEQLLLAAYDPLLPGYGLFPDTGSVVEGRGFLTRSAATRSVPVKGRLAKNVRVAVSLAPGWNLVANPLNESVPVSRVQVVRAAGDPKAFNEARGLEIGLDFFGFIRGAPDPATGAPETGGWVAATSFEPGQAYFVRVLVPEGASLVFAPASDARSRSSAPAPTSDGWRVRATLVGGGRSQAVIGQSSTATSGFDAREDSPIAPPFAGPLIQVLNDTRLYRDVRRYGRTERYTLGLSGLTPGRSYRVDLERMKGGVSTVTYTHPITGLERSVSLPASIGFKAQGTEARIAVRAGGTL